MNMIGKKVIVFYILFLFLLAAPYIANAENRILKYGYIEFAPFTYTDSNKKPSGFIVDWAAKIIEQSGFIFKAKSFPVVRLAEYIVGGKIDIWIGLKTLPHFNGTTYKGTVKITDLVLRAYTLKGSKKIRRKEDLSGLSVIVLRGYSYGGWINFIKNPANRVKFINANKHTNALKMLKADRAEYLLDYKAPQDIAQREVFIKGLKYNTIKSLPIYIIVSKKRKDGGMLLKKLEKKFIELKKEGKLKY